MASPRDRAGRLSATSILSCAERKPVFENTLPTLTLLAGIAGSFILVGSLPGGTSGVVIGAVLGSGLIAKLDRSVHAVPAQRTVLASR